MPLFLAMNRIAGSKHRWHLGIVQGSIGITELLSICLYSRESCKVAGGTNREHDLWSFLIGPTELLELHTGGCLGQLFKIPDQLFIINRPFTYLKAKEIFWFRYFFIVGISLGEIEGKGNICGTRWATLRK